MADSQKRGHYSSESLLSLGEAAERLGVHPATVRRWAKNGDVLFVLTPGGHRRFPESEISRIAMRRGAQIQKNTLQFGLEQNAMMQTRSALDRHRDAEWISKMDEPSRQQQREMGRRVMGLLMQFVASDDIGDDLLLEARRLGHVYSETTRNSGLSLTQTLQALMFFRDNIIETMVVLPESVQSRPDTNRRIFRRANTFLNEILLGVSESAES